MIGTDFDYLRPASLNEALDMASRQETPDSSRAVTRCCRNGNSGARVRLPSSTWAASPSYVGSRSSAVAHRQLAAQARWCA
jgi:hypothetical protein